MMQRVTITSMRYHTRYSTFSLSLTWLAYNATHYHNFNVLPHALPYIFSKFSMVWGYLQRVTARHRQIYKKIYINALQIAQNQANLRRVQGIADNDFIENNMVWWL